ncbi:hypothetical protein NEIG_02331 [Nematocida sp. ERTm5]|nr:hypothetical protein NEIG_02331 [Nematocida sp. ERTm5]
MTYNKIFNNIHTVLKRDSLSPIMNKASWSSGLRRGTQDAILYRAWVRIPQMSFFTFLNFCFMAIRTPRRAAAHKRTPYKQRVNDVVNENPLPNSNLIDLIKYYKEKEQIREEYITALKQENTYLRSSLTVPDQSSFTGLKISKTGDIFNCKQTIEKEGVTCSITFLLEEHEHIYVYTYKESKNVRDLPEYLQRTINFPKTQVKIFFFNIYQCVAKDEDEDEE